MRALPQCKGYLLGMFYGYPECCVDFFNDEWIALRVQGAEFPALLRGTGFVACPVCAATHTDEEMTEKINAFRSSLLPPFPAREEAKHLKLFDRWLKDVYYEGT